MASPGISNMFGITQYSAYDHGMNRSFYQTPTYTPKMNLNRSVNNLQALVNL